MSDDLPPLPEPYAIWETWGQNVDVFTAKQTREYTKQAVEAEREACITELERNADKTLDEIIAAIRARGNT